MNEDVATRAYALREGEGEARWWLGGLATVKATGKETGGRYTLIEVFEPEGEGPLAGCCSLPRMSRLTLAPYRGYCPLTWWVGC